MKIHAPLKGNPRVTGRFEKRQSFLVNGVWTLPFHYGIDWAASAGTPIYAAHDGTVTKSGWDNTSYGGGNELQLTSGDWATWYLHMQKPSALKVGAKVKRGDLIGYVGSTGISTGPHLHFELHNKGKAVNPQPYLDMKEPAKPKPAPKPTPTPELQKEDDDGMYRPTVHVRTQGNFEATRAHPEIGKDLKPGQKRKDGKVTVFRGYEVTTNQSVAKAWARTHARGFGQETSRTNRADYIAIQKEAQRISVEITG